MEACNVTLPIIFSLFLYFGVIIANSQLPEYTKTRKITRNRVLQKSFADVALPQTPLMKLTTLPGSLVSWDRINSHPTTLSTITSRPMPPLWHRVCSLHLFSGGIARLVLCPQTHWVSAPKPHWETSVLQTPVQAGSMLLYVCVCNAHLLSSTRQRFAVFRLSVKQVTSQADKHA